MVREPFNERFTRLREAAGLTKTALAADRYTVSFVSQIESGARKPSDEALAYFAERLSTSPAFLETGVPPDADKEIAYRIEQARSALAQRRNDEALSEARVAAERAADFGFDGLRARALVIQGGALLLTSRYRQAIDVYEEALEADSLPHRDRGLAVSALATAYRSVGDLRYASEVAETYLGRTDAEQADPDVIAELNLALVSIYVERGDGVRAERAAERALDALKNDVAPSVRANVLWAASRVAADRRDWDQALDLATRAQALIEESKDSRQLIRIHVAAAFICLDAEPPRINEAGAHLAAAEEAAQEGEALPEDLAHIDAERGRLELLRGQPQDALRYIESAMGRLPEDELEQARSRLIKGRALAMLQRLPEALNELHESSATFKKRGARVQEATCWSEIGRIHVSRGDHEAASDALRAGLDALDVN